MSTAAQEVEGPQELRIPLAPSLDINLDPVRNWFDSGESVQVGTGRADPASANGWILFGTATVVAATFGYLAGSIGENVGVDKDRMIVVALSLGLLSSAVFCVRAECRW